MMMSLGLFVFSLSTAAYQSFARQTQARRARNERHGQRAAPQFLGPGADTISLSGTLYPELTGGPSNIERLRKMMLTGKAYTLMDGDGNVLGYWSIDSVGETRSEFLRDGTARKIEFELALTQEPDDAALLDDLDVGDLQ